MGRAGITLPTAPATEQHPVTDDYFGTKITDLYRWLEDAKSPKTRAFIAAQNAYTKNYLDQVKNRPTIARELDALHRVDQTSAPVERSGSFYFMRRLADENQASLYVRHGWTGKDERLIDATKLSADQNTSIGLSDIAQDGSLLAYDIRQGGADEQEIHFLNLKTGAELADKLPPARYNSVSLSTAQGGVYYARYEHTGALLYFHKFGSDFTGDKLIFGKEYKGEKLGEMEQIAGGVTRNGHYLVVYISRGVPAKRQDILLLDLRKPGSEFVPLVYGIESRFGVHVFGDQLFVETDWKAPNGRILKATLGTAPEQWPTIIPESKIVIESSSLVGGKLFVERLHDVKSETSVYSLTGKLLGTLDYPGIGAADNVYGNEEARYGFFSFQSLIQPPTIYRYDTVTGKREIFAATNAPFHSSDYELKQIFYTSKDGTRIPMFIAGKKGLARDGSVRVLMTGYGGFDLSMTPTWNPEFAWWLERGGYFALPNLRGGGEYGEEWHKQAMFEHKQNVFDDWFAAAEYLIAQKYTSPAQLAIRGRSNGGLLMGASMTQRPDLYGAIWCGYPLLDMLRYQNFLIGRLWSTEYGTAEKASEFAYIREYSPYQKVKQGTRYPAILFFTGDNDTRVDPLHARKMTALMQTASSSGRPVLLHYSLKGGHSSGVSVSQLVEDETDEMAFLWTETTAR
jgi:prolyl oligopeptidase